MPDDRILVRDAVGAEEVAGQAGGLQGDVDVVHLAHRDVMRFQFALILQPSHLQREELSFGDLGDHPGQFVLHELMRRDRLSAELNA